eukprot:TRINITY_DN844_c0_g1_i2.p1 TRINITY_DN844_c0_g1~~TRINITY_DN844_c0_g1_i2.p1  ORF type:complete len:604 (+),score=191.22 TRINITY_DN844_c0_g1_i2:59-1813(+)
MSLQPKKGLEALWPIKGKRVLVRVDFNVPIKGGVIQNDYRIRSALPTIRKIVDQGGICVVMSHLGRPTGAPMRDDANQAQHDALMRTWVSERGRGKTVFFAVLPSEEKVWILEQLKDKSEMPKTWKKSPPKEVGNGKTHFFAGLPEATKTDLLNQWTAKNKKETDDFTNLRKYNGYEEENTLEPVAERLGELLGKKVGFAPDCLNAAPAVDALQNGDVLLLENVRFYKEENSKKEDDRLKMATVLASYGDYYVCDAFGTAHRDSASMTGIPKVLGHGVAGYLMKKEIDSFARALTNPSRPMCAIVGGSKVSDKIKVLENLVTKVNKLFIGGAMAYVFLKAKGHSIGKSYCEKGQSFTDKYGEERDTIIDMALDLVKKADECGVELFLPEDHVCNTEFKGTDSPLITESADIPSDHMALDIGPKTRARYVKNISSCATVVWNGPMGVFEIPTYAQGTFDVAKALAECNGMTIIGGGDSASAAEMSGYAGAISHVSTGGGASLELLEGKNLPGISALDSAPQHKAGTDAPAPNTSELRELVGNLQKTVDSLHEQQQAFNLGKELRTAGLTAGLIVGALYVIRAFKK